MAQLVKQLSLIRYIMLFKVYDGADNSGALIGSYCGIKSTTKFRSSSYALHVHFSTDSTSNAKGFVAGFSHADGRLHIRNNKAKVFTVHTRSTTAGKLSTFVQSFHNLARPLTETLYSIQYINWQRFCFNKYSNKLFLKIITIYIAG